MTAFTLLVSGYTISQNQRAIQVGRINADNIERVVMRKDLLIYALKNTTDFMGDLRDNAIVLRDVALTKDLGPLLI